MNSWELLFAIIPGIILFLYGIGQFSREVRLAAGAYFRPPDPEHDPHALAALKVRISRPELLWEMNKMNLIAGEENQKSSARVPSEPLYVI